MSGAVLAYLVVLQCTSWLWHWARTHRTRHSGVLRVLVLVCYRESFLLRALLPQVKALESALDKIRGSKRDGKRG